MSLNSTIVNTLVSVYGRANRLGLLKTPAARTLFVRSYFAYKRFVEDPFALLVRKRPQMFAGGHILDVGANVGYTATVFARTLSPGFQVFAFEPEDRNFEDLQRTVSRRKLQGLVVPVRVAVGEKEGEVDLWRNDGHHADHRIATDALRASGLPVANTIRLPMVSIDGFLRERRIAGPIKFVKIDVQGYELAVCEGMRETMSRNPLAVAVEYSPGAIREIGHDPAALPAFFSARGYAMRVLRGDGELLPADARSLDRMIGDRGYLDLICTRGDAAS